MRTDAPRGHRDRGVDGQPGAQRRRKSRTISRAALRPGKPVTPPPGCAPGAAVVEAADRPSVVRVAHRRPVDPQLVGRHRGVEDVSAGKAEALLEVGRGQHLAGDRRVGEVGGEAVDGREHRIGRRLAQGIPVAVARKVLAEETRDVLAPRRQRVVHGRWDQHLDDRRTREGTAARIQIGLLQVRHRGSDDDPRAVMVLAVEPRPAGEVGEFPKCDVDLQRRGLGAHAANPA